MVYLSSSSWNWNKCLLMKYMLMRKLLWNIWSSTVKAYFDIIHQKGRQRITQLKTHTSKLSLINKVSYRSIKERWMVSDIFSFRCIATHFKNVYICIIKCVPSLHRLSNHLSTAAEYFVCRKWTNILRSPFSVETCWNAHWQCISVL